MNRATEAGHCHAQMALLDYEAAVGQVVRGQDARSHTPPFLSATMLVVRLLTRFIYTLLMVSGVIMTVAAAFVLPIDFGEFMRSGEKALGGQNPYELSNPFVILGQSFVNVNTNAPPSLLLFAPLSLIDSLTAVRIFIVATFFAYILGCVMLIIEYRECHKSSRLLWLAAFGPLWVTTHNGQVYGILLLLTVTGWVLLRHRADLAAGLVIGILIAIKPIFITWPLLLLLGGNKRTALVAGISMLWLAILAGMLFGFDVFSAWIMAQRVVAMEQLWWPTNGSLVGLGARTLAPMAGFVLSGAVALALAALVLARLPSRETTSGLGFVGALVMAPVAGPGYGMFLLPILLSRPWSPTLLAAASLLLAPWSVMWPLANSSLSSIAVVVYTAPPLLVLATLVRQAWRGDAVATETSAPRFTALFGDCCRRQVRERSCPG